MSFKRRNILIRIWYTIFNVFVRSTPDELRDGSAEEFMEEYDEKKIHNNGEKTER